LILLKNAHIHPKNRLDRRRIEQTNRTRIEHDTSPRTEDKPWMTPLHTLRQSDGAKIKEAFAARGRPSNASSACVNEGMINWRSDDETG
jgi:hypothetical protein